jgi:DNA-binding PadR family transcriptional regulator
MFDSGELGLVLLSLMEGQARHGYDLIKEIETRTGGAYAPSPGIVYPTLTLLEEMGHIEAASSDGAKRLYALTPAGQAHLTENKTQAEATLAKLEAVGADAGQTDAGPIFRAMHNLKVVLQQKLIGQTDKQVLFDAVDLIDDVARKIERL